MNNTPVTVAKLHQGPLPCAEEMKRYAEIHPDFPQNIFNMARDEQQHRFAMDQQQTDQVMKEIKYNTLITCSGMICSVICVLFIMGAAVICAVNGQTLTSALIGTGGIGLIVFIFVCGSKLKNK